MWLPTHNRLNRRLNEIEKRVSRLESKTAMTIAIRKSRKKRRELVLFKIVPGITGVAVTVIIIGQALKWF